jgi:TM2 domain-containing membrane protein YozV
MKDKNVAGILALFLGWLGVHRFYLGQIGLGIFYLMFFWIMWIVALIDALVFFSMDKEEFDIKYNKKFFQATPRRDTDFDRRQYRHRERYDARGARRDAGKERRGQAKQYERPQPKPSNQFKISGINKYKEYDYDGAIEDFLKALEIDPKDIALHFNLACAYSLNEDAQKSFFHLDKAISYGFNDFKRIKEHDALAYLRIQPGFEDFEKNGFRLVPSLDAPKEEPLESPADLLEQLKKLGELREKGLLTEEEFANQKRKLLE